MGDILSKISGGRLDDKVIILWILWSEFPVLLNEVASDKSGSEMFGWTEGILCTGWKLLLSLSILISPESDQTFIFFSLSNLNLERKGKICKLQL